MTYTKSSSETSTISPRPPHKSLSRIQTFPFSQWKPHIHPNKKTRTERKKNKCKYRPHHIPLPVFLLLVWRNRRKSSSPSQPSYIPFIFCFSFNCFFSSVFTPMEDQIQLGKIKVKTLLTVGRVMKERRDRNGQLDGLFFWVTKMPRNPSAGPALDLGDFPALYSLQIRYFAVLRPRFLKRSLSLIVQHTLGFCLLFLWFEFLNFFISSYLSFVDTTQKGKKDPFIWIFSSLSTELRS